MVNGNQGDGVKRYEFFLIGRYIESVRSGTYDHIVLDVHTFINESGKSAVKDLVVGLFTPFRIQNYFAYQMAPCDVDSDQTPIVFHKLAGWNENDYDQRAVAIMREDISRFCRLLRDRAPEYKDSEYVWLTPFEDWLEPAKDEIAIWEKDSVRSGREPSLRLLYQKEDQGKEDLCFLIQKPNSTNSPDTAKTLIQGFNPVQLQFQDE